MILISGRLATRVCVGLLLLFAMARAALAADPLVDPAWVVARIGKPGIVFVDLQPSKAYMDAHIPGAVNTSYAKDGWRAERKADKVPDMLPEDLGPLQAMIGTRLGIDNATHVVIVPQGETPADVSQATRLYWTFKVIGHDQVSLLNGGMAAYMEDDKNPIQQGIIKAAPKSFKASLRKDMIVTLEDVKKARAAGVVLVDGRPDDQYVGIAKHPKATVAGTIGGAKSVPYYWTMNGTQFRSREHQEKLFRHAGAPTGGEQIAFCNTGQFASVPWFVASELFGNKQAKLYDGSMVEYTMLKAEGVERKIPLD
ncbi:MAG: sulfurtransferase [Betaproteobacteria bacterium]|nr:sulfurtransferase [Betaproteobacteria bacterium]